MDKLFLKYQGKYLALWTIEALFMLDTWYVSVAEIPKEPMGKARWIRDVYEDIGPMGGILSGLIRCREEALLVVPCDTFGVDASMGRRLLDAYERTGRPVFFQDRNKIFPFPGIYRNPCFQLWNGREKREFTGCRVCFIWRIGGRLLC